MIGVLIGNYRILEKIGQGGMALVYKAVNLSSGSIVAIKVLKNDQKNKKLSSFRQFEHEINTTKNLTFERVVPVLESGIFEGTPYFVMPYYSKGTLKNLLGQKLDYQQAAQLLLPLAETLSRIHKRGIIHRDIKPSNLLLDASGQLFLSDFGIAKRQVEAQLLVTIEEETGIGTPEYMAPEQALGKSVDGRADIYALGHIFYQLISAALPYVSESRMGLIWQQANQPPRNPAELVPGLPSEAAAVILKAIAVDPEDRFLSMEEFSSALKHIILGQFEKMKIKPIPAEKPSSFIFETPDSEEETLDQLIPEPAGRKRRKKAWWFLPVLLVFILALLIFFVRSGGQNGLSQAGIVDEQVLATEGRPTQTNPAELVLPPTGTLPPVEESTSEPVQEFTETALPQEEAEPKMAVITSQNAAALTLLNTCSAADRPDVISLAENPDSIYSALGYISNTLYVWNPADLNQKTLEFNSSVNYYTVALISRDGHYAAAGWMFESNQHVVRVWDLQKGSLLRSLPHHTGKIQALDFSHNDKLLASASADTSVILWDLKSGTEIFRLWHSAQVTRVLFSADDRYLASVENDQVVRIWDVSTGKTLQTYYPGGGILSLQFSLKNDILITGTKDRVVFWDINKNEKTLQIVRGASFLLVFSDETLFALFDPAEEKMVFYLLPDGSELAEFSPGFVPFALALSADNKRITAGGGQGQVEDWGIPLEKSE